MLFNYASPTEQANSIAASSWLASRAAFLAEPKKYLPTSAYDGVDDVTERPLQAALMVYGT